MYISKKAVAAVYKLVIGIFALVLEWYLLIQHGWSAFRLFPAWVLLLTAIYFLVSALYLAINTTRDSGKNLCPVLEGMILMGFLTMSGMALASMIYEFYLPELPTAFNMAVCIILPAVILLDWLILVKKGRWRAMIPLYWLALPVCYVATMIFTAIVDEKIETFRYPVEAFNYLEFGLFELLGWGLVFSIIFLVVGYVLFLVDFAMSGKLAKKIVLPHIRTVVVDEPSEVEERKHDQEQKEPFRDEPKQSQSTSSKNRDKTAPATNVSRTETIKVAEDGKVKTQVKPTSNKPKKPSNQGKPKQNQEKPKNNKTQQKKKPQQSTAEDVKRHSEKASENKKPDPSKDNKTSNKKPKITRF